MFSRSASSAKDVSHPTTAKCFYWLAPNSTSSFCRSSSLSGSWVLYSSTKAGNRFLPKAYSTTSVSLSLQGRTPTLGFVRLLHVLVRGLQVQAELPLLSFTSNSEVTGITCFSLLFAN